MTKLKKIKKKPEYCEYNFVQIHILYFEAAAFYVPQLKGYPTELVPQEIDRMLDDVGLSGKRHMKSETLSGGMKRKLCVAIALVGDSQASTSVEDCNMSADTYFLVT